MKDLVKAASDGLKLCDNLTVKLKLDNFRSAEANICFCLALEVLCQRYMIGSNEQHYMSCDYSRVDRQRIYQPQAFVVPTLSA